MPSEKRKPLSPKQRRFVQEYLLHLNATKAAELAGYKNPNKQGPRLLVNVGIAQAIKAAMDDVQKRTEITADLIVQETWTNYQRCVKAEKFAAANKSLELLGRHVGAFPNKHEHSGPNNEPIPITIIRFNHHKPADAAPNPVQGGG
jgi:hypothetical protein